MCNYVHYSDIPLIRQCFIIQYNIIQICVYSIFIVTLVIFRPYKRNIHTYNEAFLLASLGVVSWTGPIATVPVSIISFIIFFVVIPYCLVWMCKKCTLGIRYMNSFKPNPSSTLNVYQSTKRLNTNMHYDDHSFADRLVNPESYDEHHTSTSTD